MAEMMVDTSDEYSKQVDDLTKGAKDPVVRSVIEQLDKDVVSSGDRAKLRGATDAADARATKNDAIEKTFNNVFKR